MSRISPDRLADVRANFYSHGETMAEFARKHGLDYFAVVNTLSGRAKGTRGDSHRAAVLLGLKPDTSRQKRKGAGTSAEDLSV